MSNILEKAFGTIEIFRGLDSLVLFCSENIIIFLQITLPVIMILCVFQTILFYF